MLSRGLCAGDPALIHPFLAEIGKEKRRSADPRNSLSGSVGGTNNNNNNNDGISNSNLDTGAAALHLAIRCASRESRFYLYLYFYFSSTTRDWGEMWEGKKGRVRWMGGRSEW
jgi:hypothetical protein